MIFGERPKKYCSLQRGQKWQKNNHTTFVKVYRKSWYTRYLSTSKPLSPFEERLVEDLPEDGGHEAVDEEVDGGVDDHAQLGDVPHQQNPER